MNSPPGCWVNPASPMTNAEITNSHLAAIVGSSSDAILSKNLDCTIISWNAGAERMFGYSAAEMVGKPITLLIPPELIDEEARILARLRAGERIEHYETIRVTKDGRRLDVSLTISPIHDASGQVVAASKIIRDMTERKHTEAQLRLLMREVNHRAGNLLSVVQAIARQAAKHVDPATFVEDLTARIVGLAACHTLLADSEWRNVDLAALVRAQLEPFGEAVRDRVSLVGPQIALSPSAAQTIGMALHELVANACKHGALSEPRGRLAIVWLVDETAGSPAFTMNWHEDGGPRVDRPGHAGFGQTVLVKMTEAALRGHVTITYAEDGFSWNLRCPIASVLGDQAART